MTQLDRPLVVRATSHARCAALVVLAACASPARRPATQVEPELASGRFADRLVAAIAARDAPAAAALFAPDAVVSMIGEPTLLRGRPAIAQALTEVGAHYPEARLIRGRIWAGPATAVIEVVFAGRRLAGPILGVASPAGEVGVVGAAVCSFDRAGRVRELRLYLDLVTLVGQLDAAMLPPGMVVRSVATAPPAGAAVAIARGTPDEARRLATANQVWAGLAARDAGAVMAASADDYVLDDVAAPEVLDRAGTTRMVAGFLGAISEFAVVSRGVQLAAGADAITEVEERVTFRGKPVVLHSLDVKRFRDGKIIAEWQYTNGLEAVTGLLGLAFPVAR